MIRPIAWALALALAPAIAGCGGREERELLRRVEELTQERDKLAKIAGSLDGFRADNRKLDESLAEAIAMGTDVDHAARLTNLGGIAGVTRNSAPAAQAHYTAQTFQGTREILAEARRQAGALMIEKLTIAADGSWTIVAAPHDYASLEAYADEPGVRIAPPLPKPGPFSTRKSKAARAEIAALEKEKAKLERLIGEPLEPLDTKRARLERLAQGLAAPNRLATVVPVAGVLTGPGDATPCTTATISAVNNGIRFWCAPRNGRTAEATVEAIREAFKSASGLQRFQLGPMSIDDAAKEPVQGGLTVR